MKRSLLFLSLLVFATILFTSTTTTTSSHNSADCVTTLDAQEITFAKGECPKRIYGPSNVYLGSAFGYTLRICGQTQFNASWSIFPSTGVTLTTTSSGATVFFNTNNTNTSHVIRAVSNGQIFHKTVYPDIEL